MAEMLRDTVGYQTFREEVDEIITMTWRCSLLWMACNYFYNYGLMYSSITSSMVLNNSAPMWVWLFSLSPLVPLVHREKFELLKGLMIWLLMVGFVVISYADLGEASSEATTGTIVGNSACLLSAVVYAVYSLYMKIKIPKEREYTFNFTYLLGFMGFFNLLVIFPVLVGLDLSGWE